MKSKLSANEKILSLKEIDEELEYLKELMDLTTKSFVQELILLRIKMLKKKRKKFSTKK